MIRRSILFLMLWLAQAPPALAHPMDFGQLKIRVVEGDRLAISLRLHMLALEHFRASVPRNQDLAFSFFSATLAEAPPRLGGALCRWRAPEAHSENEFAELNLFAICTGAKANQFSLDFPLPFLKRALPAFQLAVKLEGNGEPVTLIANAEKPVAVAGVTDNRTLRGFVRLGMAHIGALPSEWKRDSGAFRLPEGIDHICFVLALVVAGGTLLNLLKCISGFTLGHSITLALSTFRILHIHSRWVEACIALSIAVVAGSALLRPRSSGHRWIVAAIFGTVHGLGFATVLHDLDLSRSELVTALFGFNVGVELGQCVIVLTLLIPLLALRKYSEVAYVWTQRTMALALLLIGSYWFLLRAVD
jgi:hypothetical protein